MAMCPPGSVVDSLALHAPEQRWSDRALMWVREARAHRIICLVAGIWLLNAFDLAFTLLSNQHGLLYEENPVARRLLGQGVLSIVLYKIGMVLVGTYPLLKFRKARITELGTLVVFFVYALLAVRWSTCFDLYSIGISCDMNFAELMRANQVGLP